MFFRRFSLTDIEIYTNSFRSIQIRNRLTFFFLLVSRKPHYSFACEFKHTQRSDIIFFYRIFVSRKGGLLRHQFATVWQHARSFLQRRITSVNVFFALFFPLLTVVNF